jgi:hypothetical protein
MQRANHSTGTDTTGDAAASGTAAAASASSSSSKSGANVLDAKIGVLSTVLIVAAGMLAL